MPDIAGKSLHLRAQARARPELQRLFQGVAHRIRERLMISAEGADGTIPLAHRERVIDAVGDLVQGMFAQRRAGIFDAQGQGQTPYAQFLTRWTSWVTYAVVKRHAAFLEKNLPPDVVSYLKRAVVSEQVSDAELTVVARRLRLFDPSPFATYDPAHRFVAPEGYRLSDSIWETSIRTRVKVDRLVGASIRDGMSAVDMADLVERFLLPNRAPFRTKTPYGVDGSFDARRLTRTEISAGYGRSVMITSEMNPFVSGIRWVLSGSHPKVDICDDNAARSPYTFREVPPYPAHPHDLCNLQPDVTVSTQQVVDDLRLMMQEARQVVVNPADADAFTSRLIGDTLLQIAKRVELVARAVV